MDDARHDSEPAPPEEDPLQRIAALERRVAVLTRENERRETFLAVLRHRIFGHCFRPLLGEDEPGPAQPARHGSTSPG